MKINPYFRSTLAKPFQGKVLHEVGTPVVISAEVQTKALGKFLVIVPDPVSLNLNNAQNAADKCEQLRIRINSSKQFTVFSKILIEEKQIAGLSPEKVLSLDPQANILRKLDEQKVYEYMQSSMGIIVSLITSIESFLNLTIPYDYTLEVERKGIKELLDKAQIVRRFSIEDKIELIGKIKNKEKVKQEPFWSTFKEIKGLRDEIIHFKNTDKKVGEIWNPILVFLFDSDLQKLIDDTITLIDYFHPDYLKL